MGSCNWLKTMIISPKRVTEDRPKQGKISSPVSPISKRSKWSCKHPFGTSKKKKSRSPREQKLNQDIAAARIQNAFRSYKARKAFKRLKAVGRCRYMMTALAGAEKQADSTLKHLHFWMKMHAEIKSRRLGMVNDGRLGQKKLENRLKLEAKLQELEVEWCGGSETMEEILQRIQQREVAAVKRERAMAYAFSHQWRANSSPYFGQAYYDLGKDSWGWSWKERWIAVRPWEKRVQQNSPNAKKTGKTANPAAMRIVLRVKSPLSNGNGKESAQASELPGNIAEEQKGQEAQHQ